MDILKKFTLQSLKLNKKRTITTIIGIALSVALICAVAGMFESFRVSVIKNTIENTGEYHTMFRNASMDSVNTVKNNKKIESYYYIQGIGYAEFNSTNSSYPYLYIKGFNDSALSNSELKLIEGRLPQNDSELIITEKINKATNKEYKVGDTLKLDVFSMQENVTFSNNGEELIEENRKPLFTKEYKIVGKALQLHYLTEFGERSISVITYQEKPTSNINLYVMYKNPQDTNAMSISLAESFGLTTDDIFNNRELLRWNGVFEQETLIILYVIVAIIFGIIIFTSVFVIKNSFSISIIERKKQYGILASVGATKKQIKASVLYEGFILGLISIPIGIIIGLGATYTLIALIRALLHESLNINLIFVVPYSAIFVGIILGAVTIYLSCIFIARKTAKISPIEAIRSNNDINVKNKRRKSPKIIKAWFKTGGVIAYKNMQRNKKAYRTPVVSLVISVVLFISMSAFTHYFFEEGSNRYATMQYNLEIRSTQHEDEDFYSKLNNIVATLDNEKYSIVKSRFLKLDNKYINFDFAQYFGYYSNQESYMPIYAVGEDAYKDYVKKLGGNYDDYKDKGILIDYHKTIVNDKKLYGHVFNIKNEVDLNADDKIINLKIAKNTNEIAMPFTPSDYDSYIVVSDEMMERIGDFTVEIMAINANNPTKLEKEINNLYNSFQVNNFDEVKKQFDNINLIIKIFSYGFIIVIAIIGITNIINTLTTSINLRKKEFAMLKSIGTTKKEFTQMINLESIFLGLKVLIIGIPIGSLISFIIYYYITKIESIDVKYDPNLISIIISAITVFAIVGIIMNYAIKHINKQNIIETIRNDNI